MKEVKTPRMTRAHYAFIADIIRNMDFNNALAIGAPIEYVAIAFAEGLKRTNPNFKPHRFFEAALDLTNKTKKPKSSPSAVRKQRRKPNSSSPRAKGNESNCSHCAG